MIDATCDICGRPARSGNAASSNGCGLSGSRIRWKQFKKNGRRSMPEYVHDDDWDYEFDDPDFDEPSDEPIGSCENCGVNSVLAPTACPRRYGSGLAMVESVA